MHANALFAIATLFTLAGCQTGTPPDGDKSVATAVKAHSSGSPQVPLRAVGQEPGWMLTLTHDDLNLSYQYGQKQFQLATPKPEHSAQGYRYAAINSEGQELILLLRNQYCADSMSGMPYPYAATVTIENQTLEDCAE